MVDVTVRPARATRHIDDGDIVLTRGGADIGTVLLADISGRNWTRQKLQRLSNALQAKADNRRLITDLEDIDPDKVHALAGDTAWFLRTYGGRMFIDGNSIVSRSDKISFALIDGDLVPHIEVVV